MGHVTGSLNGLIQLAERVPEDQRGELVRQVANLFLTNPERFSSREMDQFADILCIGIQQTTLEDRAALAERFALTPYAPRSFMNILARDDVSVADPVLTQSDVLSDEDLISSIKECSEVHAVAISLREELSERVCAALIATGHPDVLISLAENTSATLSRDSLDILAAVAEQVPAMQLPLIDRDDLPVDLVARMFFFVSPVLRQRVLVAAEHLSDEEAFELMEAVPPCLPQSLPPRAIAALRDCPPSEAALLAAVGACDMEKFVFQFASLTDLPLPVVHQVLSAPGAHALAVACKSAEFARETFCALVLRTSRARPVSKEAVEEALALYASVPALAAQRVAGFWRVMPDRRRSEKAA